jgi:hypothetical protein
MLGSCLQHTIRAAEVDGVKTPHVGPMMIGTGFKCFDHERLQFENESTVVEEGSIRDKINASLG